VKSPTAKSPAAGDDTTIAKSAASPSISNGEEGGSDTTIKQGRWKAEEHETFISGLKEYGKDWEAVAKLIPSRSIIQIRSHAQKYFKKLSKTDPLLMQPYFNNHSSPQPQDNPLSSDFMDDSSDDLPNDLKLGSGEGFEEADLTDFIGDFDYDHGPLV
jgi:SHAQKYF class myb-like DNA-binding protein